MTGCLLNLLKCRERDSSLESLLREREGRHEDQSPWLGSCRKTTAVESRQPSGVSKMKLSGGQSAVQCLEQLRESLHFLKLVLETVIPWTGRYWIISSCLYSELVALRFLFIYLFFKTLTLTCALTECTFGLHFFSLMLFIHYFILSFFHSFFLLLTCRLASSQKSP